MKKIGILPPVAPVSSAAEGAFDAFFAGKLSSDQVEALDELFPETNHWAGGAVRLTTNAVA
jgi:hypothetical protein